MRFMLWLLTLVIFSHCNQGQMKQTNRLSNSTSPYLLQHADNPVEWYPWGDEALAKAKDENKPILLSIGYSSCHWCHVMAHESFEDDSVAAYMNEHFVNIKLDREERPDIDNIYMDAIQAMGLRGGWPLNVFLTPEQKPFYGGTYFPKDNWMSLLASITDAYENNFDKLNESALKFADALQASEAAKYKLSENAALITDQDLETAIKKLTPKFDKKWGGMDRAPKFPMPSVWQYLAAFSHEFDDEAIKDHLLLTLDKIAEGGIYDQIGGGFSRYSVDGEWHVPHFEKMLYDNGQLLSLYANAYKISKSKKYKEVLLETAQWIEQEMTDATGGFYAALDADSEGVEGKFYVWSYDEITELAGDNFEIIRAYYDVSKEGNWENHNVLRRLTDDATFLRKHDLTEEALNQIIDEFKTTALAQRSKRIRPGLDSKIISGWNGLALTGLLDAYQATGESLFIKLATTNAHYIKSELIIDGKLKRTAGHATEGFLEDYSAVIQAFIKYYETNFDRQFLDQAIALTDYVIANFYDENEKLFFYTGNNSENLIARKKEVFDNVIPASNSIMAENFFKLGMMLDSKRYKDLATNMVNQVSSLVKKETAYMSNWSLVTLMINHATPEFIIVGENLEPIAQEINAAFIPNKIIMADKEGASLPLFEYKTAMNGKPTIYVCFDKTCKHPVDNVADALKQLE